MYRISVPPVSTGGAKIMMNDTAETKVPASI
jgi:hypothetical protein